MKTPDEIKKGLECCTELSGSMCPFCPYAENGYVSDTCREEMASDALAYIRQLEAQLPRWISVEEKLPKRGEVLVCTLGNWVGVAWHHGNGRFETGSGLRLTVDGVLRISHWMPLPEPPKEE